MSYDKDLRRKKRQFLQAVYIILYLTGKNYICIERNGERDDDTTSKDKVVVRKSM